MGGDMERVEAGGSPSPSGSLGKKFVKPALFILVGILIAFPIFSLTYYTMDKRRFAPLIGLRDATPWMGYAA
jgi:hypothetical protein